MNIEDKLASLPSFTDTPLDENYTPVYEVRDGHTVIKRDQAISISGTFIGPAFLDSKTASTMQVSTELPRVLSEIYTDASKPSSVAGYLILDTQNNLKLVSLSRLAHFLANLPQPLTNAVQDINYTLGKRLKLTSQVHRIFTYYPNKHDDQSKGYRNQDGSIKMLLPDRTSRSWFCSLTYRDLRTLYDYYNKLIFDNKLCQAVSFKWLTGTDRPTYVELTLEQESDILKTDFIEGYKVMKVAFYINREFFKEHPHLFLELFIHELIHCQGIPAMHNTAFSRCCELARAKVPELDLLDVDLKDITEAKGKWATVKTLPNTDTVAMFCPICENLLKPGKNNSCICIQGHQIKFK